MKPAGWAMAAVLTVAVAAAGGAVAAAQGRLGGPGCPGGFGFGRGPMGHGGPGAMMGMWQLDLTDAQRSHITGVMQSHRDDTRALRDRLRTARRALQDAVNETPVNESLVRQRAADVAAVEADGAVLRARVHAEVFQVLTPEQQQKAKDLRAQRQQRMDQRMQRFQQRQQKQ